jgi:hypothetical protein
VERPFGFASVRILQARNLGLVQLLLWLGSMSILQASNLGRTQLLGILLVYFLLLLHSFDQPIGSFSETPDLLMDVFPECIFRKALALQSGHA